MTGSRNVNRLYDRTIQLAQRLLGLPPRRTVGGESSTSRPADGTRLQAGFAPSRPPNSYGHDASKHWPRSRVSGADASYSPAYSIDAVFRWYMWFTNDAADDVGKVTCNTASREAPPANQDSGSRPPGIPGFPAFQRQSVDRIDNAVRVRFFDRKGEEAGALWLRPDGDSCTIDVPDGTQYVIKQSAEPGDMPDAQGAIGFEESGDAMEIPASLFPQADAAHNEAPRPTRSRPF